VGQKKKTNEKIDKSGVGLGSKEKNFFSLDVNDNVDRGGGRGICLVGTEERT